jgi:hypothetical protein
MIKAEGPELYFFHKGLNYTYSIKMLDRKELGVANYGRI